MQGHHEYQPELFSVIDIEVLVPKTHLLRKIDKVLDLSFLPELTAPLYSQGVGRPSIDPVVFIRMVLLTYLYNIESDRRLCEEVGYNLAYRWFSRLSFKDPVPDHSSFTRIRDRLGESTYKIIFQKTVEQCIKAGFVKGEQIMADGSMIAANASLYAMKTREEKSTEYPPGVGINVAPSKDGLSNQDLRRNSIAGTKITNATHVSQTDPDATLSGKEGEYKALRYKTHDIIDAPSRVILDCHVTTGAVSEHTVFPERLSNMQATLGLEVKEVIADRGFGAMSVFEHLESQNISSNIPLWSTRVGTSFEKEVGFNYDREANTMTCPKGHLMKQIKQDQDSFMFVVSKLICDACPLNATCVSDAQRRNGRGKRVRIHRRQDIYQGVLAAEKNPEFKDKLRERMWRMEGIFAEGKSQHGLRRARYRRLAKVQMQVYMISSVQNLKRLAAVASDVLIELLRNLIFPMENFKFSRQILKVRLNF